ncbi:L-carnitine dehydrogenase [Pseudooceanicola marinus]|uniref:L-carnitine dehydrogenase n=1 Tax=Pseudooceanicola marinus TaxID=396013 RepID=A0A1X6ZFP7_9RHOB|nr:thioesterase family protein [Pseudooceanicola marinus]PJE28457.1 thioesterase [Pseudooceanicola marinus]SLN49899.1 L-carnitine dehydrogenase [Pseudooceanicola marinus]
MPYLSDLMTIKPEWIDYNGHLNMAYYGVFFDVGGDPFTEEMGMGQSYLAETGCTTYAAEFKTRYLQEVHADAKLRVSLRLVDVGPKSFHYIQELIHEDGWVAATGEGITLHVDQSGPKVAPFPEAVKARLDAALAEHQKEPVPDWVGKPMGLRK